VTVVHRALDVLLHQVGVDGDRRRVSGAGRGDDLGSRIDDVAGCPGRRTRWSGRWRPRRRVAVLGPEITTPVTR
jgi:hypothetical protein